MKNKYQSPWFVEALQSEGKLEINKLETDMTADMCIAGGGFTGGVDTGLSVVCACGLLLQITANK